MRRRAVAVTEGAVALRPADPQGERLDGSSATTPPGIVVDVRLLASGIEEIGSSELSPRATPQQTIHGKLIASGYSPGWTWTLPTGSSAAAGPVVLLRQGDGVVPVGLSEPGRAERSRMPGGSGRVGRRCRRQTVGSS